MNQSARYLWTVVCGVMCGFVLMIAQGAHAAHSFDDSQVQLSSPVTLRFNFSQEFTSEHFTPLYYDSRPANTPVCGQARRADANVMREPGLVYRGGWFRENRWSIMAYVYIVRTCFSGGQRVLCWSDIPYGQTPETGDGFQSFSALMCEVTTTTQPSINNACRYPVSAGEIEMSVTTLNQSVATHNRSGLFQRARRQISVGFAKDDLGRERRLSASVHCWRPTNDVQPITMDDIQQTFGSALTVR